MKLALAAVTFAITTLFSSHCAHAADEAKQFAANHQAYAVQVGTTTVAIIPAGSDSIEATAQSTTHNKETGTSTLTGDARIIIKVAGKPTVTISAAELVLRPQK